MLSFSEVDISLLIYDNYLAIRSYKEFICILELHSLPYHTVYHSIYYNNKSIQYVKSISLKGKSTKVTAKLYHESL